MAWQAPKTNWTSADGVLNTDLNRIEENIRVIELDNRTPDQTQAPPVNAAGPISTLFSWLANRIKAITGTTNWWDAPAATIAAIWAKFNATTGHKHTGGADDAPPIPIGSIDAAAKTTAGGTEANRLAVTNASGQVGAAATAPWSGISGKPSTFAPSAHAASHASGGADALSGTLAVSITGDAQTVKGVDVVAKFDPTTGHKHTGTAGDGPVMVASGVWSDTTTAIAASSTFTKTIALGFAVTKGRLIAKGSSTYGAIAFFTTDPNNAIAAYGSYGYASSDPGYFFANKALNGYVTYYNSNVIYATFGDSIIMQDLYLSGSDLIIVFQNLAAASKTLQVQRLYWEVER